jgi:hypothetical protein
VGIVAWRFPLGYFLAREGHHRGSILLTLKQTDHKVSTEIQFGICEWEIGI